LNLLAIGNEGRHAVQHGAVNGAINGAVNGAVDEAGIGADDEAAADPEAGGWHQTACILCSINCGIEVRVDGPAIVRIRGDKSHPTSAGYTCEKALRLDHYQRGPHRLTTPLRRRADGSFEPIDWDTAIAEVAARFRDVIDAHGGESIAFYGGGGQGNHLGGGYGSSTRSALGIRYSSNALAQEKTGEFWVDGQLFGRSRCHTTGDYEHAQVAVFWGKNPWQSHGFPQARRHLKAIANDPARTLVVVDPRRTESADLADIHLRPVPGGDAHLLAALLAVLVDERLVATDWLAHHANGLDEIVEHLRAIDIAAASAKAGVDEADVRRTARVIGQATGGVSIFEDLGIQQAPHSTLNSYLEKLVVLLTGNFGVPGGMNIHSHFQPLVGGTGRPVEPGQPEPTTPTGSHRLVTGLVPCNVMADEILTDHPARFRAMLVESGNPVHSVADSARMRAALRELELVVVIDVALTETAREADYVLPASSQLEKWECTFFNLEFPHNAFHLRRPVFEPLAGTLPEYEIHSRLCRALGAYTDDDIAPLRAAAEQGRAAFMDAFFALGAERPDLGRLLPVLLYETLGPTLTTPDGVPAAGAAAVWGLAHRCALAYGDSIRRAGIVGEGLELGDALFDAILASPSGVTFTVDEYDETMRRIETADGKVSLAIPMLLDELDGLAAEPAPLATDPEFPFVLSAGERRSSTANTIYRDPAWRKKDAHGALRMSPVDAAALGLDDGARARITTRRGVAVAVVEVTDTMSPGHVALPNGFGLGSSSDVVGVAPNELTSSTDRDRFAGTPHHKHVRANIERVMNDSSPDAAPVGAAAGT
jgi:anaerobic selenocysteine-containing dehydrogenase